MMELSDFLRVNMKKFCWITASRGIALAAAFFIFLAFLVSPGADAQALPASAQPSSGASAAQAGQAVDQIVAIINSDVITLRELQQRIDMVQHRLSEQGAPIPPQSQLRSQVLDQMLQQRMQLQQASDDGIEVTPQAVQDTLQRLAAGNHMSLEVYRSRIEAEGVPWPLFVEDAKDELILGKVREREVDSKIFVSDAEVANYIATHRGPGVSALNDLHMQHILIAVPDNASTADLAKANEKALQIIKQAGDGSAFAKLAKQYSQAPDAAKGGDLGFRSPDDLPAGYAEVAAKLRPGEVAPEPLRTDKGIAVIRLVERRAARTGAAGDMVKITQTQVRHILLRVGEGGSEEQIREKIMNIAEQIKKGGDFAQFARTYSQDGSAAQGGDLGWVNPGEMVPEFERVMNQLEIGQVSAPVRTEFGYHLIQVEGRRTKEATVAQQEDAARQAIGSRKAGQAYSDWLRELHDSSYIQYKPGYGPS
jgi:peptidyl-prolyl cis-trans isomerase SurA